MEFTHEKERIYKLDEAGNLIAEITFPINDGVADINHTFVDGSLRGQGVAGKLVTAAAEQLRNAGIKVVPTCSYAKKWFDEHVQYQDMLV